MNAFPPPPSERRELAPVLRGPLSTLLREAFLRTLPSLYAHNQEVAREALQSAIWVVGLATGLLAYSSLSSNGLGWMPGGVRQDLLVLLLGCVTLGVLYRLQVNEMDLLARHQQWGYLTRLSTLEANLEEFWHPDELTGIEGVINALKDSFDLDGDFLRKPPYDMEMARGFYRSMWEHHIQREREALDGLGSVISANEGNDELGMGSRKFAVEDSLEATVRISLLVASMSRYALLSYYGELACFIAALAILGAAAVAR